MQWIVVVSWSAMAISSAMVIAVALGYWLRDVRRNQDTDSVEPSPISERAALYMLLAGSVFIGIRLARGQSLPFGFIAFAAAFIGFGLSAGWYLLSRRAAAGPSPSRVAMFSGGVAASFGALSALTPS